MFSLIRFIQGWLWPAVAELPAQAGDSSSMADLVRLLERDGEPSTRTDTPSADTTDGSGV